MIEGIGFIVLLLGASMENPDLSISRVGIAVVAVGFVLMAVGISKERREKEWTIL